jgi:hypothetical protein
MVRITKVTQTNPPTFLAKWLHISLYICTMTMKIRLPKSVFLLVDESQLHHSIGEHPFLRSLVDYFWVVSGYTWVREQILLHSGTY